MDAENDLRYAQPSGMWVWVPTSAHDPITCNPTATTYLDADSIYSQGSASPSLPSHESPEVIDLSHYEESPSIPIDNTMFYPQPVLPSFNPRLPADEDTFNALLEEVVTSSVVTSSSEFDDLVDWSASSAGGASPPSTDNYYPSPNPANLPTPPTGNSPIDIPLCAPASLPPLQPMIPTSVPQQPTAPYPCSEPGCGRGFNKMCDLRKHSQQHSKPHRCELCPYSSAELRGLHRHHWAHHREWAEQNRVPKQITNCRFPGCKYEGRLDNVRRHMNRHYKQKDKRRRRR